MSLSADREDRFSPTKLKKKFDRALLEQKIGVLDVFSLQTVAFPKNLKKMPKSEAPPVDRTPPPPVIKVKKTPIVEKPIEIAPVYTNGHSSPIDEPAELEEEKEEEEDGQWSDWEPSIERAKPMEIKAKWDPEAPLGSEFEIAPVVLAKKQTNVVQDDVEDFFKDMAPKVQTVELMRQLETMFTSETPLPEKFGVLQDDQIDNQENESGNAWDD